MTKASDWKRITIYVLPEEHKAVRSAVLEQDTNMSEFGREAILKKVEEITKE